MPLVLVARVLLAWYLTFVSRVAAFFAVDFLALDEVSFGWTLRSGIYVTSPQQNLGEAYSDLSPWGL